MQLVNQLTDACRERESAINSIDVLEPELGKVASDLADTATQEEKAVISDFVAKADARLTVLKKNLGSSAWMAPGALPASPDSIIGAIAAKLDSRAMLEESTEDPDKRAELEREKAELVAREWLGRVKDDVKKQVSRHADLERWEACKKDTATNRITSQNTQLTQRIVTDALCKRFEAELRELRLETLEVKLDSVNAAKGQMRFGLRIANEARSKVHHVASEGEQRCIALAAFLAELSQASHESALVFDDPVSSLDHLHRQQIAARLVKEASKRQVIVFTHDAVFLHDLEGAAKRVGVNWEVLHLEWNNGPGRCVKGHPWEWMGPGERFDKLDKLQRELARKWNPIPSEDNKIAMRRAYSYLRATIERIVEKVIFGDVVLRFRTYINMKNLQDVVGFSMHECSEVQRLMQRCHDVTDAHDPSEVKGVSVPNPTEFADDIAAIRAVWKLAGDRKKVNNPTQAAKASSAVS